MKKTLTLLGAIALTISFAFSNPETTVTENDGWIHLGNHLDKTYLLQKDSLKVLKYDVGDALRMTMQVNGGGKVLYNNIFFWVQSCKQKQGEAVYFTLDQKASQETMVVVGGNDIGSRAITHMCNIYDNSQKRLLTLTEQEKKENQEWQDIAITDVLISSYKKDTAREVLVQNVPGIEFSGRIVDLKTKTVQLQNWSTTFDECKAEKGILYIHDLNTDKFTHSKYSFHSGSMSSLIAEDLCKKTDKVKETK